MKTQNAKKRETGLARRHRRVRGKISGTAARPRMCVTRSNNNIYVQVIDDVAGKTLCSASSLDPEFKAAGNPVYLFSGGLGFAVSWWISGIPFDISHCVGNFVIALVLFVPLRELLEKLLLMLRDEGEEKTFEYLRSSVLKGKPFPWENEETQK